MERRNEILRMGILGMLLNIALAALKFFVGIMVNSVVVLADGMYNLSEALKDILQLFGIHYAKKDPRQRESYGVSKTEYVHATLFAVFTLLSGVVFAIESVHRIMYPMPTDYNIAGLVLIAVAIVIKYVFSQHIRVRGNQWNSQLLISAGEYGITSTFLSMGTFTSAFFSFAMAWDLEGYLGVVFSLFICKSGIDLLLELLSNMIGKKVNHELLERCKEKILGYPQVNGVEDIQLHNYGPKDMIGTVLLLVDDYMTVKQLSSLSKKITGEVEEEFGIHLTVGVSTARNEDTNRKDLKNRVEGLLQEYPQVLELKGFFIEEEKSYVSFSLVFDYREDNPAMIVGMIRSQLEREFPDYKCYIQIENDYGD